MDINSAACVTNDVAEAPSMSKIERGYNIFKGDPLYILNDLSDPGEDCARFFDLTWNTDALYKIELGGSNFFKPEEYDLNPTSVRQMSSKTSSITSAKSYKESVSKAVSVGGSGAYSGVELGGSVGVEAFSAVSSAAMTSKTATESSVFASLYSFKMKRSAKLSLTKEAVKFLSEMKTSSSADDWMKFFGKFGTHLTEEGLVGAWERIAMTFNKDQRETLTQSSSSFQSSLSIGVPNVFGYNLETSNSKSKEIGNKIKTMNVNKESVKLGDHKDLLNGPGVIQRKLVPICEYIDYTLNQSINKNLCYDRLKTYCISALKSSGMSNSQCEFPKGKQFQCVFDADCGDRWQKCSDGFCKRRECLDNTHCTHAWDVCDTTDGVCQTRAATTNACSTCKVGIADHWTSCDYGPKCPRGYDHLRWENGPCWMGTQRRVCRKYKSYVCPPCKNNPLKGTCNKGNRGNGCCSNGGSCSQWGWCGWSGLYLGEKHPSWDECKKMTRK